MGIKKSDMAHKSVAQAHSSTGTASDSANPFLEGWSGSFGVPPFHRIAPEHFRGAFERAFAEHDAEIAAIADDPAEPDFTNTVEALERAGRPLGRVSDVFGVLTGAHTNEALLEIEREISPRRARHWNGILLNGPLFRRIDTLWHNRDKLELNA